MTTFLLTLLIIWGAWKLLRWWLVRRLTNRTRDIFEQFARQAGAQTPPRPEADPRRRNKTGWDRPQKKKKIDAAEGEYIEYEELKITQTETTVNTSPSGTSKATFRETEITEERITDAEWEDIP